MECGSTSVSLSRMRIVDFSSIVFADSTGVLVKAGIGITNFEIHSREANRYRTRHDEHASNSRSAQTTAA